MQYQNPRSKKLIIKRGALSTVDFHNPQYASGCLFDVILFSIALHSFDLLNLVILCFSNALSIIEGHPMFWNEQFSNILKPYKV